jgi:CheY-like chemotaxis protein
MSPQPMIILLAEDNALNQRVVQLMLAKLGQDVDIVDNGYDAVLAVQGKKYDVVLMDVQMPQMDGLEATRRIRALPIVQPDIVALTANSQPEEQQACRGRGHGRLPLQACPSPTVADSAPCNCREVTTCARPGQVGDAPDGYVGQAAVVTSPPLIYTAIRTSCVPFGYSS